MAIADTFHTSPTTRDDEKRPIVIHTDNGDFYVNESFLIDDHGPGGMLRIIERNPIHGGDERTFWVNADRVVWIGPRS